jgi:hypothetical protein
VTGYWPDDRGSIPSRIRLQHLDDYFIFLIVKFGTEILTQGDRTKE